jgi:glycerol-3-phosphate acyltransferase PlsX
LLQFAVMGDAYSRGILGVERPTVAIVSNGEEEGKGSMLVQDAAKLLRSSHLNFVGNAEGKDIPAGIADVIVTDGFTGNVIVKLSEGVVAFLLNLIKAEIQSNPVAMLGGLLAKPAFEQVRKRLDYREYGGGALLGVDGVVIVAHGRSDALAIKSAVRIAKTAAEHDLIGTIRDGIAQHPVITSEE